MMLNGRDITHVTPHRKVAEGLAFVPQTENVFATMTILENLQIAVAHLPKAKRAAAIEALFTRFPNWRPGRRVSPVRSRAASGRCWRWRVRWRSIRP